MWKGAIIWEDKLSVLIKFPNSAIKIDDVQQEYHEQHQQSHHHPHHDVHVLRQASGPERAQDGRQSTHWASHSLTETCKPEEWATTCQTENRFRRLPLFCDAQVSRIQPRQFHSSPCVFSAVTLEKSETCATATNGKPKTCRNTPMMNSVSFQEKPPTKQSKKHQLIIEFAIYFHIYVIFFHQNPTS